MKSATKCRARRWALPGVALLLAACAQGDHAGYAGIDGSPVTTGSLSQARGATPPVPGEDLEARMARLEHDLAELKLDYSVVRPSFERLVAREEMLTQRVSALELDQPDAGPFTASIPAASAPPVQSAPPDANATTAGQQSPIGLHLASYRSRGRLESGWATLKADNPAQLGGMTVRIQRIDTGSEGVFERLIAGPVASRAAADEVCGALKANGVYCMPMPFEGAPL